MASFTATPAQWTNSSDANFRLWGDYISNQMAAVGLVQTADTGQIDWVTVLTPAGINTFQGYEIWRFNDTLQATAPVYIKIEYGESSSVDSPCIRVQFGSGSNGAGTLTGNLSTTYLAACATVAGACSVIGSGSTNRFCMIGGFTTAGGYGMFFGFERSKDASGNDTSEAVLAVFNNTAAGTATSTKFFPVWSTTLGDIGPTTVITAPALFPPGATAASGSQVIVAPILHSKGIFMNPGMNFAGYFTENIAINGTPSVYVYGVSRTYYSLPGTSGITTTGWQGPGGGTEALLIRYE
jgi:hypothetical protein